MGQKSPTLTGIREYIRGINSSNYRFSGVAARGYLHCGTGKNPSTAAKSQKKTLFFNSLKENMITADQLKDVLERENALRGYL